MGVFAGVFGSVAAAHYSKIIEKLELWQNFGLFLGFWLIFIVFIKKIFDGIILEEKAMETTAKQKDKYVVCHHFGNM